MEWEMGKLLEDYYANLPDNRRVRILDIRTKFVNAVDGLKETMKYKMPTFEKGDNWVCVANQKNYISVYFCDEKLIGDIKINSPEINTGKGCVRIKDTQVVPIDKLLKCFIKAMESKKNRTNL